MRVAIVTGASRGLGQALARGLAERGWALVLDARGAEALEAAAAELTGVRAGAPAPPVRAIAGDVTDPAHRRALVAAAVELGDGTVDAIVNNASLLGPSPQPELAAYPLDALREVYEVNVLGPLALVQDAIGVLRRPGGRVLNVTSDAAVEAYEGWGGYGSSKAALEQLTAVLGAEQPDLLVYRVDPGDLRTQMHQDAFPGEDISDRPLPDVAVPGLVRLLEEDLPSGRYKAQELAPAEVGS